MTRDPKQTPAPHPRHTNSTRAKSARGNSTRADSVRARAPRSSSSRTRHPIRELGRAISWHRRKLAVLAAMTAVLAGVNAAAAPAPPEVTVLTATATLQGGTTMAATDLATTTLPTAAVPEQALTQEEQLVGQVLTGPVARGQVLTKLNVLQAAAAPGRVLAPLRLADAGIVRLLHSGDLIDVIAADPQGSGADVVADRVRIATISRSPSTSMLGPSGPSDAALVLVEVNSETAKLLAQASVSATLSVTLR